VNHTREKSCHPPPKHDLWEPVLIERERMRGDEYKSRERDERINDMKEKR
jgi:hypothetical protein